MHNNTHRGLRSVKLDSFEATTTSYVTFLQVSNICEIVYSFALKEILYDMQNFILEHK